MRRKDREIVELSSIEAIIKKAIVCRIGMVDQNRPYVVPLCFGYNNKVLYFHGALRGRKIDVLKNNPNVCFEFDAVAETIQSKEACDWGMKYQSVIGFGKVVFIEDAERKREALSTIMAQYSDREFQFPDNIIKTTVVFKVEIDSMTGKQSGY